MARALTPPTLGQLHRPPGWVLVYCTRYHPLAPLIIRWGPDMLRRCARCTMCGHKGATLQGPGWKNGYPGRRDDCAMTTRCERCDDPGWGDARCQMMSA
jgi:hypothetical protein